MIERLSGFTSEPVISGITQPLYHHTRKCKNKILMKGKKQMEKITQKTFDMLNEAVKLSGLEGLDTITQENITKLLQLPDAQLQTIINNLYLVSEQRGFQNLWSSEDNPFREFLFDMKNNGWTIQDYMIDILEGMTPYWDESYTDSQVAEGLVKDYEQKFESAFHMTPFSKQFATTINEKDYSKYFYPYSLQSFVDMKINNLPSSAEIYLEKQVLIDEVRQMITDNDVIVKDSYDPNSDIGIKHMIEDMKTVYKSFKQPTNMYNKRGVISITPSEDMIFTFMKPSTMERLKVYVNSAAYNLDEVMLKGRVIFIPEDMTLGTDTSGNEILAMILDRRALVVGLRTWKMRDFEIPNKLRRNYFLSIEGIRGHNDFINAVAFKGAKVANFQSEGSGSNAYLVYDKSNGDAMDISVDGERNGYFAGIFRNNLTWNTSSNNVPIYLVKKDGSTIDCNSDYFDSATAGIGQFVIDMENLTLTTPNGTTVPFSTAFIEAPTADQIYGIQLGY